MKNAPHPHDESLSAALDALHGDDQRRDLTGFEHEVWSEIAMRGSEADGWFRRTPAPALAACCIAAMAIGSLFGMSRAQAYQQQAVEQRYVQSIHPVFMSADHADHDH